jgi:hypothetical protein
VETSYISTLPAEVPTERWLPVKLQDTEATVSLGKSHRWETDYEAADHRYTEFYSPTARLS